MLRFEHRLLDAMSYLEFHLAFLLPPVALLLLTGRKSFVRLGVLRATFGMVLIPLLAVAYTTPWDSLLIRWSVWGYGEGRVIGTLFGVPLEEYLFFVLQPLLTGIWFVLTFRDRREAPPRKLRLAASRGGMVAWLVAGLAGVPLVATEHGRYLGLIVVWAAPVLALQWAVGGGIFSRDRLSFALGVAMPTVYLWVADRVAIQGGVWHVSGRLSTGIELLRLPLEEAVFFLVTNLMVVQGLLLYLRISERIGEKLRARGLYGSRSSEACRREACPEGVGVDQWLANL